MRYSKNYDYRIKSKDINLILNQVQMLSLSHLLSNFDRKQYSFSTEIIL
jgi:hypothetical protein